jgi:NADH-quinone oxidoreductase subunit N
VSLQSKNEAGLAASLKYFLLSALSTAFLLLGVCILYFKTGSTNYEIIDTCVIELLRNGGDAYIELAFSLILFTLLFKLSAAPFYQWAPDLYENIQTNITMWMILIPKLAVLTFLVFFSSAFSLFLQLASVQWILFITSTLSIIIGSIALSNQWYIKRFFAFSGISHVGFMLLALYSLDTQAFFFYMFIYAVTTVNIFSILIILSQFFGRDLKLIQDLSGIFKFNPFLSFAFALNLFSLSGVCLIFILLLARIFY